MHRHKPSEKVPSSERARQTKMSSYKIIGTDLKEYGPVSADQIRQWIIEGRVDSQTKLQRARKPSERPSTNWKI